MQQLHIQKIEKKKRWPLPVLRARVPHQAALLQDPIWGDKKNGKIREEGKAIEEIQGVDSGTTLTWTSTCMGGGF